MSHTPGPWKIDPKLYRGKDGGNHAFLEIAAERKAIWLAKVQSFSDDPGEYVANARLIAAAPDLLAALAELLADEYWQRRLSAAQQGVGSAVEYGAKVLRARAAIARAEGRPA